MTNRRYDIDWLRIIAIGLLLIYHTAIGFQPWGNFIGFITNNEPWQGLWIPMTMLNVWRIPLLFYVSGMGVYFALQNRNIKQLIAERAKRILLPYVFGIFCIVPVHMYIWMHYYKMDVAYIPNPAHLWFLGNIFVYVILFSPLFFYLKRNNDGKLASIIKKIFSHPLCLLLVVFVFIVEVWLVTPAPYELYAMTWHGFWLGLIAFLFGFLFVFSGDSFWKILLKWRWALLVIAITLYIYRTFFDFKTANVQLAIESCCWIFSVFAFGYKHLNFSNKTLVYLKEAAYPVYIMHMMFLYLSSALIFPLGMIPSLKFIIVLICTCAGSVAFYEFVIRRFKFNRLLFGLKTNRQ